MCKINIKQIPDLDYEGYLWYSNQSKPKIINSKNPFKKSLLTQLPFVIEGNLWAEKEKISLNFKNIDGEYQIFKYDLNKLNIEENSQTYIAHNLVGIQEFTLYQHWKEKKDPLCENMKTLVPSWSAFTGFIKNKGGQ